MCGKDGLANTAPDVVIKSSKRCSISSAKASQVIVKQLSEGMQYRKVSSKVEVAAVCKSLNNELCICNAMFVHCT